MVHSYDAYRFGSMACRWITHPDIYVLVLNSTQEFFHHVFLYLGIHSTMDKFEPTHPFVQKPPLDHLINWMSHSKRSMVRAKLFPVRDSELPTNQLDS